MSYHFNRDATDYVVRPAFAPHPKPRRPALAEPDLLIDPIQRMTADHFGIRLIEMKSQRRGRGVARPRQVAMYLARNHTPRSLPQIGRSFGGRDHTTVMHACAVIERLRREDTELDADIRALEARL